MRTRDLFTALCLGLLFSLTSFAQSQVEIVKELNKEMMEKKNTMTTYVIERDIPEAGNLTQEQLAGISKKSNEVLSEMGAGIEWLHSYVTDNKVYCVYKAENETLLRQHAEKGGFPVNKISTLSTVINPDTGKE